MFLVFCLFLWSIVKGDYNIIGDFRLCHATDQIVELDLQSGELFNSLSILRIHEDEFHIINISGEPLILNSLNGVLLSTSCVSINEIFVPMYFSDCTTYTIVNYVDKNLKNSIFLTRTGILRNTTVITACDEQPLVFNLKNNMITIINKTAMVNEIFMITVAVLFKKKYTIFMDFLKIRPKAKFIKIFRIRNNLIYQNIQTHKMF